MSFTVYPAIDLREGKVVRLKEGDPNRMIVYSDHPAETARRWMDAGASWLHVVNLDGAFGVNDLDNRQALEEILKLDVKIQFGGGMRSRDAIERAIKLGVSRVVLGTIAIEMPDLVASAMAIYGEERVSVGIDARDGMVRVRGWQESGGVSATGLALQMRDLGLRTVIFTDVSRDGLRSGLNITSTRELAEASGLDVIASGGVHSMDDVIAAKQADLVGVIVGRALYDGTIDLSEAIRIASH
jgi:phosphoribosylformimino-5-aminoimidazole carboxamide ribotide isomerase